MGLFSNLFKRKDTKRFLGIDVGLSGIKLVELMNEKGRARLVTYAYVDLPATSTEKPVTDDIDATAELISRMVKKARCTTVNAISSLPVASVFTSILSVTYTNDKELDEGITLQAKKLMPVPLEEIALYSKVIDTLDAAGGKKISRVLVTGAPKALVAKTTELFKKAGLNLLSLETDTFAMIRSLVGKDRSTIMIVDIGSQRTNISVIEKGIPFLTRSIATGGVSITQSIASTLGIPYDQADALKRDIRSMQAIVPTGDITPILQVLLKPILDEIRYSFGQYQSQSQADGGAPRRIDKIILTGGSSLLPRLPEFITQVMNVNAYLGDPWARVIYPQELRPVLEEIGSRFTVSIGCAMRDLE